MKYMHSKFKAKGKYELFQDCHYQRKQGIYTARSIMVWAVPDSRSESKALFSWQWPQSCGCGQWPCSLTCTEFRPLFKYLSFSWTFARGGQVGPELHLFRGWHLHCSAVIVIGPGGQDEMWYSFWRASSLLSTVYFKMGGNTSHPSWCRGLWNDCECTLRSEIKNIISHFY